ncbi:dynein heavy chain, N-terminal region 1-domain-containing protein [Baffinella frigidus]|nr:dynein heavy chain, N-terminal region 1-domain-containing protein [Cryptophyta sp. CCMP2293]
MAKFISMGKRLYEPMAKFISMGKAVTESEEGKEAIRAYKAIVASMEDFEDKTYAEWSEELEHTSKDKLNEKLLRREEADPTKAGEGMLRVNFDPALVCLLREIKDFKLLDHYKSENQTLIPHP